MKGNAMRRAALCRGFTVAETMLAMAIILLMTAACILTCTAGAKLQRRASDTADACSVASEFAAAFSAVQGRPNAVSAYHAQLQLALGFAIDAPFSGGLFTVTDEEGNSSETAVLRLSSGGRALTVTAYGALLLKYEYTTEYVRVVCEADFALPHARATGYVSGYSAVCAYEYGREAGA